MRGHDLVLGLVCRPFWTNQYFNKVFLTARFRETLNNIHSICKILFYMCSLSPKVKFDTGGLRSIRFKMQYEVDILTILQANVEKEEILSKRGFYARAYGGTCLNSSFVVCIVLYNIPLHMDIDMLVNWEKN